MYVIPLTKSGAIRNDTTTPQRDPTLISTGVDFNDYEMIEFFDISYYKALPHTFYDQVELRTKDYKAINIYCDTTLVNPVQEPNKQGSLENPFISFAEAYNHASCLSSIICSNCDILFRIKLRGSLNIHREYPYHNNTSSIVLVSSFSDEEVIELVDTPVEFPLGVAPSNYFLSLYKATLTTTVPIQASHIHNISSSFARHGVTIDFMYDSSFDFKYLIDIDIKDSGSDLLHYIFRVYTAMYNSSIHGTITTTITNQTVISKNFSTSFRVLDCLFCKDSYINIETEPVSVDNYCVSLIASEFILHYTSSITISHAPINSFNGLRFLNSISSAITVSGKPHMPFHGIYSINITDTTISFDLSRCNCNTLSGPLFYFYIIGYGVEIVLRNLINSYITATIKGAYFGFIIHMPATDVNILGSNIVGNFEYLENYANEYYSSFISFIGIRQQEGYPYYFAPIITNSSLVVESNQALTNTVSNVASSNIFGIYSNSFQGILTNSFINVSTHSKNNNTNLDLYYEREYTCSIGWGFYSSETCILGCYGVRRKFENGVLTETLNLCN